MHRDDHLAVDHRRQRANPLLDGRRAEIDQLERALEHVGVRIFLVGDQQVGALDHRRREVAVRIELGTDHDVGPDDGAHPLQQVALAVVVAVGDHRAVQAEQHHVDRQRRPQVGEQLLAQRLVARARRRAARLRAGHQALDQVPAQCLAAQPRRPQRAGEIEHLVRMGAGRVVAAVAERRHAGGHGREGVGFGGDAAAEDTHGAGPG